MIPSLYPLYDLSSGETGDGSEIRFSSYCRKAMAMGAQCRGHYEALRNRAEGYYECPFGFTTRTFLLEGRRWAFTGVIAHPRFQSENERRRSKEIPQVKVARSSMDNAIEFLRQASRYKADVIQQGARVL